MAKSKVGTSPNPWKSSLKELPQPKWDMEEDGHPLDAMRGILLQWPGEETANLSNEERHNRFIRIVAGYPLIDVGRVPFDWPMHPKSIIALKISTLLDTLSSPDPNISLRSAILNADLNFRTNPDKYDLINTHRKCLFILIRQIKKFCQIKENIPIEESFDNFSIQEYHFLTCLHGTDNNTSLKWWPLNQMFRAKFDLFEYIQKPSGKEPTKEEKSVLGRKGKDPNPDKSTLDQLENMNLWNAFKKFEGESEVFNYNFPDDKTVTIEFVKIQSWIDHWCNKKMKGTAQRLWRGASAILESVLARLRHVIIEEYGPSSIIIDGGGRIVFLSLGEEAFDFEKTVLCSLLIDKKTQTRPIYNLQISTVIESIKRDDEKPKAIFEREVGESFAKKHLPPFLVTGQGVAIEGNGIDFAVNENCMICGTREYIEGITGGWDRLIEDTTSAICIFHRLLYTIGQATRKNDASIRKRGKPWVVPSLGEVSRKKIKMGRMVVGISKLDLNSLGIIFSSKFDESDEWSVDIRRRRSFRFNSYWWQIVQKSIDDEELEIDAIAAWIAAGDDITIAEYVNTPRTDSKKWNGLNRCLNSLNSNINEMFTAELGGPLSFCAGYSLKQNGKSLLDMMDEATKAEKLAKRIWKTKIQKTKPELLFNQKTNEEKKFCSARMGQGEKYLNEGYSMILEYDKNHDDGDDCQNSNPEQCKPKSNCITQQTKKK